MRGTRRVRYTQEISPRYPQRGLGENMATFWRQRAIGEALVSSPQLVIPQTPASYRKRSIVYRRWANNFPGVSCNTILTRDT